jgi:ElaB/YqjD/DUF883 family membrane-anchored ribosome-binding protein
MHLPRSCLLVPRFAITALLAGLVACGGGRGSNDATPDDVDETTSATITESEYAAFSAPRDSVLTAAQVEAYLKASLLQFDLVRNHSQRLHDRVKEMEQRGEQGGAIAGLRNLFDAGRTMAEFGDLIGGSYVRASRTLGYNPAEMEWVRERMAEVAFHLTLKPVQEASRQGAQGLREQAEQLRQQMAQSGDEAAGFTEEHIRGLLEMADQAEGSYADAEASRSVAASLAVLQRTRSNVTDPMWTTIGLAGGTAGLVALTGLSDPNDQEAQKKLDEFRQIFTDALDNRTTPGMEYPTNNR